MIGLPGHLPGDATRLPSSNLGCGTRDVLQTAKRNQSWLLTPLRNSFAFRCRRSRNSLGLVVT